MLASSGKNEGFFRWVGVMNGYAAMRPKELGAEDYAAWLEKFKPKKTTDDCYTPPEVYNAVLDWAVEEYALHGRRVLRPFVPDGDFTALKYRAGDVVVDNPPFSMLTKIRRWYDSKGIDYLLFAPALTLFTCDAPCSIVVSESITYANGAVVNTSFITSLDDSKIRTAPALKTAIRLAVKGIEDYRKLPKYIYPANAVTAAQLGKVASVQLSIPREQVSGKIDRLDCQLAKGKGLFGGGYLISDGAAAEIKAAEIKAAEVAVVWELSADERVIIEGLNSGNGGQTHSLF